MNTEQLLPSIIVDDHGTVKHAEFIRVLGGGQALYRVTDEPKAQPPTRLEADTNRALDLIGKALGS